MEKYSYTISANGTQKGKYSRGENSECSLQNRRAKDTAQILFMIEEMNARVDWLMKEQVQKERSLSRK